MTEEEKDFPAKENAENEVLPESETPEEAASDGKESTDTEAAASAETEAKRKRGFYDWVEMIAGSVAAVMLIFTLLFRLSSVDGTSMINTLQHGDRLIVSSVVTKPKYGDIVAIQKASGYTLPLVKRVIATGGETVIFDFSNWKVSIKGKDGTVRELDEYYVNRVSGAMKRESVPYTNEVYVPEGYIFVMGDNRNGSTDSRDSVIGLISEHEVMGKALFRVFPLGSMGSLGLKK